MEITPKAMEIEYIHIKRFNLEIFLPLFRLMHGTNYRSFQETTHPLKAVQTNILGTLNLLKITVEEQNIKFILATSTDKACLLYTSL